MSAPSMTPGQSRRKDGADESPDATAQPVVLRVAELAARWKCSQDCIKNHIVNERLPAFDISENQGLRRHWRIRLEDVLAFEAARANAPRLPESPPTPRRRRAQPAVREFF